MPDVKQCGRDAFYFLEAWTIVGNLSGAQDGIVLHVGQNVTNNFCTLPVSSNRLTNLENTSREKNLLCGYRIGYCRDAIAVFSKY